MTQNRIPIHQQIVILSALELVQYERLRYLLAIHEAIGRGKTSPTAIKEVVKKAVGERPIGGQVHRTLNERTQPLPLGLYSARKRE